MLTEKQLAIKLMRGEVLVDNYGTVVTIIERHKNCICRIPCQERFTCESDSHKGDKETPWCNGGSEDNYCDWCWFHNCKHKSLSISDRNLFICNDCGEELGR
jgi:hypothetical protein